MRLQAADGGVRDLVVALGDQQVERARAQQRDAALRLVLTDHALQVAVPRGELGDGRHDEAGGGAGERPDDDLAAHRLVLGGELGLGGIELGEDAVGGRHEAMSGRRQPHAATVALEQRDAGLALELRQRLRDRRRRVADYGRHLGDRAAPRQLAQEPEPLEIQHRSAQLTLEGKISVLVLALGASDPGYIDPPRYEPLPGLAALPAWIWRRAGRGVRTGAILLVLAVIAGGFALVPAMRDAARDKDERLQRERAGQRAALAHRLEAEQRPVRGRSRSVAPTLPARAALMDELAVAITSDARARVRRGDLSGRIRRAECEPYPRTVDGVGADQGLSRRRGRYSCLAITSEFSGGVIGHSYRALVDFDTGRYAYCKIAGQSGPSRDQFVTTPRACGG